MGLEKEKVGAGGAIFIVTLVIGAISSFWVADLLGKFTDENEVTIFLYNEFNDNNVINIPSAYKDGYAKWLKETEIAKIRANIIKGESK